MFHPEFAAPIRLLHEADGFVVTVETRDGQIFRGTMQGSEDTMNCELRDVSYTDSNGNEGHTDSVYIRGSNILYFVLPDMFANSPIFTEHQKSVKGIADGFAGNLRDKNTASKIRNRIA